METLIGALIQALATLAAAFADEIRKVFGAMRGPVKYERTQSRPVYSRIETYLTRNGSDSAMIRDIAHFGSASFFGVSHPNTAEYLVSILTELGPRETIDSLEIYYASSRDGELWERKSFHSNLVNSRQQIAAVATSSIWAKKFTKPIHFFQSIHHSTFGGCVVSTGETDRILYVVNYLPSVNPDFRTSLTYRLPIPDTHASSRRSLSQVYLDSLKVVRQGSVSLGEFSNSLWDRSAVEWSSFVSKYRAYGDSMAYMCKLADVQGNERVVDLGCADGTTSRIIEAILRTGHLTVLDSSPQMIALARTVLAPNVAFSLQSIPALAGRPEVDLNPPYDAIFIHLALSNIASDVERLRQVFEWCHQRLVDNGRLLVAMHNTAVRLPESDYDPERDPLRRAIIELVGPSKIRTPQFAIPFTVEDVRANAALCGFDLVTSEVRAFPMTMTDRLAMWKTPVVLDSLIDTTQMSREALATLILGVSSRVAHSNTPDMTVRYWKWTRRSC
jgi:predicted O-methyltransferase YrrM